jgi:hypothetical protein
VALHGVWAMGSGSYTAVQNALISLLDFFLPGFSREASGQAMVARRADVNDGQYIASVQ